MGKTVGRITSPAERQRILGAMLMKHYASNRSFKKDWWNLLHRYKRLLVALLNTKRRHPEVGVHDQPATAWDALGSTIARVRTMDGKQSRNLRQYRQELIDLCNKWGLRCAWGPAWLHAFLLQTLRLPLEPPLSPPAWWPEPHIRLDIPYSDTEKWQAVQVRILAEARRQRDEAKGHYRARGMLRDTEPNLDRDIRWLYERIALGLTPPRKMKDLARGEGPAEDLAAYEAAGTGFEFTYRDAISRRARELRIRLPQGRPRKNTTK